MRMLILASLCLILTGPVMAEETLPAIDGVVSDSRSAVLPQANVQVHSLAFNVNGNTWSVLTDSQGRFHVSRLLPGLYTVYVTRPGYTPSHSLTTLTRAQLIRQVDVVLTPLSDVHGIIVVPSPTPDPQQKAFPTGQSHLGWVPTPSVQSH